jgi:hypothetical protein
VLVQKELAGIGYAEKDIIEILYMCQGYLSEIQSIGQWLGE